MNVTEVQKLIAQLSPAAARQSALLVEEITRLNGVNGELNSTIVSLRDQKEEDNFNLLVEKLTQMFVVLTGMPPKANKSRLRSPTAEEYATECMEQLAQIRREQTQLQRRAEEAEQAHGELKREQQAAYAHVIMALQRFTDQPQKDPTVPENLTQLKGALATIFYRMDLRYAKTHERAQAGRNDVIEMLGREMESALGQKTHDVSPNELLEWWNGLLDDVRDIVRRNATGEEQLDRTQRELAELQELLTTKKDRDYDAEGVHAEAERLSAALDTTHSALLEMQGGYIKERNKRLGAKRDLEKAHADIRMLRQSVADLGDQIATIDMALRGESASLPTVAHYRTSVMDLAERVFRRMNEYAGVAEAEINARRIVEKQRDELKEQLKAAKARIGALLNAEEAPDPNHMHVHWTEPPHTVPVDEQLRIIEFDAARVGMSWDEWIAKQKESGALLKDASVLVADDVKIVDSDNVRKMPGEMPLLAECGQPYPCGHAPDGGNHPITHESPMDRGEDPADYS